jgi:hypothetical protein
VSGTDQVLTPAGALAEAARWRLIGLLLERPRPGWHAEQRALAASADPVLAAISQDAERAEEGSYLRVFGPGGSASPREVAHRGWADPGRILSEVAAFYDAFAYRPGTEDPLDHVAVEAGFVGYLRLKQAYARDRGDAEGAHTVERVQEPAYLARAVTHLAALCGAPPVSSPALRVLSRQAPAVAETDEAFECRCG